MPFQNKFILSPAPHNSLAFAAQGMSQSVAVAFVVPDVMESAQSVHPKAKVRWILEKHEFTQLTSLTDDFHFESGLILLAHRTWV